MAAAGTAQTFDPDAYYRLSNKASTDPTARLWQQANGAQDGAHMWPEHKGQERSFHWQIQSLGANEYEIINRVSGQALVRRNQWEVHVATDRSARTVWRIEPDGDSGYFRIINKEVDWGLVMAKGGNDWDVHLDDAAANHDKFRWKLERVTERFPLVIRNGGAEVVSFEIVPGQNFESSNASSKNVANPEVKVILDRRPGSGGAMAYFAIKPVGRRFRGETIPCRFTGDGRIAVDTSGAKHIRGSLGASNPDGSYVWTFTLPTIQAPSNIAVGEKVKVGYPALTGSNNMIALAKKGTPDTGPDGRKQMTFLGNSSSAVEFDGLTEEGDYEARLFIDFDSAQPTVDARVAFQVVAWPKLTVEDSYKQGQPVIVKFDKLLDGGRDLIWLASGGKMMVRKFARIDADGAKAVVFVGGDDLPPGDYEARYQSAAYNKTVATSKPFKITAVTAAAPAAATIPMVFTVADSEFSYGDSVVISYANLPQPPNGGYHRMLVFKNGGKDPVQEKLVALDKTSVKLIDLAKGHYDVHLIPAGDTKPAKTLSFDVVVPPSLTVSRREYDQGAQIVVQFHDLPGAKGEQIKLFRKHDRDDARHQGALLTQWHDSGTVNNGVVTFKNLILDPGTYEARYFSSASSKAIAKCEFTVVKAKK